MKIFLSLILVLLVDIIYSIQNEDLLIDPMDNSKVQCLIFINHAMIEPKRYNDLFEKIQLNFPNLAIGVPGFLLNIPVPPFLSALSVVRQKMIEKQALDENIACHQVGHGLGGVMLQNQLIYNKVNVRTLTIISGFLAKEQIDKNDLNAKVKSNQRTLTINGEYDNALVRSSENFIFQHTQRFYKNENDLFEQKLTLDPNHPMIVINSLNSILVADGKLENVPDSFAKNETITAEIPESMHLKIADVLIKFQNKQSLQELMQVSQDNFYKPMIDSIFLESNTNLFRICGGFFETSSNCIHQNETIIMAQDYLIENSGEDKNNYFFNNQYTESITKNKGSFNTRNNTINANTSIYQMYKQISDQEIPLFKVSAQEITAELFEIKSKSFTCQEVNEYIYETVTANLPARIWMRFESKGLPLRFAEDRISEKAKDLYEKEDILVFEDIQDGSTKKILRVDVISQKGETKEGSKLCKLISPQRIIEWIQKDNQKYNYSSLHKRNQ